MNLKNSLTTLAIASTLLAASGSVHAGDGMGHNAADFNRDGMVTEDELVTFVRMNFMKMDKNNDHMVDVSEWNNEWFAAEI